MKKNTKTKSTSLNRYVSSIALSCLVGTPAISYALPSECLNLTAPATFFESTGVVCLQNIQVDGTAGAQFYKAALQWSGADNPKQFKLLDVESDTPSDQNNPSFSLGNGILSMPTVDISKQYGTERYSVSMIEKSEQGNGFFELLTVEQYINPDYIPNQTYKPYGLLSPDERESVDLLARSLPYAKLADAAYDFDITEVEGWQLIEPVSTDSGMQAGGYYNESTGQIAVAFRGTEFCDSIFSCSFDEIKESALDVAADALLTVGKKDEQFEHAVNYMQDLVTRFPNTPIILTGHSLGGALAQAMGAAFDLETFAFNSAPVPEDFFDEFPTELSTDYLSSIIHVLADIHDPISNTDESRRIYHNADHLSSLIQFDFDKREVLPDLLAELDALRFNKHGMGTFIENASALLTIYSEGW